jgi:hypothetical protein
MGLTLFLSLSAPFGNGHFTPKEILLLRSQKFLETMPPHRDPPPCRYFFLKRSSVEISARIGSPVRGEEAGSSPGNRSDVRGEIWTD